MNPDNQAQAHTKEEALIKKVIDEVTEKPNMHYMYFGLKLVNNRQEMARAFKALLASNILYQEQIDAVTRALSVVELPIYANIEPFRNNMNGSAFGIEFASEAPLAPASNVLKIENRSQKNMFKPTRTQCLSPEEFKITYEYAPKGTRLTNLSPSARVMGRNLRARPKLLKVSTVTTRICLEMDPVIMYVNEDGSESPLGLPLKPLHFTIGYDASGAVKSPEVGAGSIDISFEHVPVVFELIGFGVSN